jgi:hypothetical protein
MPTDTPAPTDTPTITLSPTPTGSITSTPTPNSGLVLDVNIFNPSNGQPLGLDIRVETAGQIKAVVFNIVGETVRKLLDEYRGAGNHHLTWDGRNSSGEVVGNGVYFLVVQQPSGQTIRKAIVLK